MRKRLVNFVLMVSVLGLSISSAGAVDFEWAVIGNAGNTVDDTDFGSVSYTYKISTTEVTTAQYVEFLNAVASTDTYGLYSLDMSNSTYYQGISRSGDSGTYKYSVNTGWDNHPVVYVSWYDSLRFVNWLNNGQLEDASTTEYGAYNMALQATDPSSIARLSESDYWLPSENEWYKAAFYDPETGAYYDYATGSDTIPDYTTPNNDTGNSANYHGFTVGAPYYSTEVGAYDESDSPYGTYDQNGNVWEWNEALLNDIERGLRGASWYSAAMFLPSSYQHSNDPEMENYIIGFRVAGSYPNTIPEPMSIGLMLLSFSGLFLRRTV